MRREPQSRGVIGVTFLDDWNMARRMGVNVLLIGASETTAALVDASRTELVEPVIGLHCTSRLPSFHIVGTLVLQDVWSLRWSDQHWLDVWVTRNHRQVISTSPVSILPLVNAGLFLESLYYRLNTVCLDARTPSTDGG